MKSDNKQSLLPGELFVFPSARNEIYLSSLFLFFDRSISGLFPLLGFVRDWQFDEPCIVLEAHDAINPLSMKFTEASNRLVRCLFHDGAFWFQTFRNQFQRSSSSTVR